MTNFFTCFLMALISFHTCSQIITFNDKNFKKALLSYEPKIDLNDDLEIDQIEALKITELSLLGMGIKEISEIKYFKNIRELILTNNNLKSLKIVNLQSLEVLYCAANNLSSVEIINCEKLKDLSVANNSIQDIELKKIPQLESLNISSNKIKSITLEKFTKLNYLDASDNLLRQIDLTNNLKLIQFNLLNNNIEKINIDNLKHIKLSICYSDADTKILKSGKQLEKDEKATLPPISE